MIMTLNALLFVLKAIEVLVVLAVLILSADFIYAEYVEWKRTARKDAEVVAGDIVYLTPDQRKANLRAAKEAEARESFFTDGYYINFDRNGQLIYRGATPPSDPDWSFYQSVDSHVDGQIFTNTEEI